MSRIDTLKKQFPHLNITLLDLLSEIDGTESHKYLQLLCKVFKKNHSFENPNDPEHKYRKEEMNSVLNKAGINSTDDASVGYIKTRFLDMYNISDLELFHEFKTHMENNRIEGTDLTKYSDISDLQRAISYANIKAVQKSLEKQVHKEYEDDKWLFVRPLSFESSRVYGSATKWCTTFKREKEYFFKYFHQGALVYVINKQNGYKAAMYIEIHNITSDEVSFWNSEDTRVDFLSLEFDDYLIPIFKRIKGDRKKNSEFLSSIELLDVAKDCNSIHRLFNSNEKCVPIEEPALEELMDVEVQIRRMYDNRMLVDEDLIPSSNPIPLMNA